MNPQELLFAETHEWVHLDTQDGARVATIGISAFAIEQLTDVVHLELPAVGTHLRLDDEFGEVESVKAVSPLYSPVEGEVIAANSELLTRLDSLGGDPYDGGWLIRVRLTDDTGLARLKDYAAYQAQCAEEG